MKERDRWIYKDLYYYQKCYKALALSGDIADVMCNGLRFYCQQGWDISTVFKLMVLYKTADNLGRQLRYFQFMNKKTKATKIIDRNCQL